MKISIIGVVLLSTIFLSSCSIVQKSNIEKLAECNSSAGKLHDTNRKIITTNDNGYTKEEQAIYYQRTEDGYVRDLDNCRKLYDQ